MSSRARHPASFACSVAIHAALVVTFSAWAVTTSEAPLPMTIALISLGDTDGLPGGVRLPGLPAEATRVETMLSPALATPLEIPIAPLPKTTKPVERKAQTPDAPPKLSPPAKERPKVESSTHEPVQVARGAPDGAAEGSPLGAPDGLLGQDGTSPGDAGTLRTTYRQRVLEWLERHKLYPARARAMGMEARVVVRITLDHSGRVRSRSIERGGGFSLLDRAAEQMVDDANPFPEPPAGIPTDALELVVPVDFVLVNTASD
jgi:protein TonB